MPPCSGILLRARVEGLGFQVQGLRFMLWGGFRALNRREAQPGEASPRERQKIATKAQRVSGAAIACLFFEVPARRLLHVLLQSPTA